MLTKFLIAILLNCVLLAQGTITPGAQGGQRLFSLRYDPPWWDYWSIYTNRKYEGYYAKAGTFRGQPYYQQEDKNAIIFIDAGYFSSTFKMVDYYDFQKYKDDAPMIASTRKYASIANQRSIGRFRVTKINQYPYQAFVPDEVRLSEYTEEIVKSEAQKNFEETDKILKQIEFGISVLSLFVSPGKQQVLGLFSPFVGAFGFLIGAEAPDQDLISEFKKINAQIDTLSIELEDFIDTSRDVQICANKISDSEDLITEILKHYSNFLEAKTESQARTFLNQMTAGCSNMKCTFAIKKILSVLQPEGKLLECDYLKLLYDGQSNKYGIEGFENEMSKEISRLILKVSQGINVLAALDMLEGQVNVNYIKNYYDKTFMNELQQAQANIKYYIDKSQSLAKDPEILSKDIKKYTEYYKKYHSGTRDTQKIADEVFELVQDKYKAFDMEVFVVTFLAKDSNNNKDYYIISDKTIIDTLEQKDEMNIYVALISKNYGGGNFKAKSGKQANSWSAYWQLQGGLQQICSNGGIAIRKERSPAFKSSSIEKLGWNGRPEYPSSIFSQAYETRRNNFGYYYRNGNWVFLYSFGDKC